MHRHPTDPGIDPRTQTHQYADMRTTIDLPDGLYRTLKTRAAIKGVTLRELIQALVEQGLKEAGAGTDPPPHREPLPVAIPARGIPISLTPEDIRRIEEEEDRERFARSS